MKNNTLLFDFLCSNSLRKFVKKKSCAEKNTLTAKSIHKRWILIPLMLLTILFTKGDAFSLTKVGACSLSLSNSSISYSEGTVLSGSTVSVSNAQGTFTTLNDISTADFRSAATGPANWNTAGSWQYNSTGSTWITATQVPGAGNNVTIQTGHTITMDVSPTFNSGKTLLVNGTLTAGINTISGAGNFTINAGTLNTANTSGISGTIQTSGTNTYTSGTITFNAGGAQNFGPGSFNLRGIDITTATSSTNVTLDGNVRVKSLTIDANTTFNNGSATLTIVNTGELTNNGSFTAGTGTVAFAGSGTVAGTLIFANVTIAGDVNFGTESTIGAGGSLQINSGGFVDTNAPSYANTSKLVYNSGGTYGRGTEWSATSSAGYPHNVQISNSTTLNLGANSGTGTARQLAGNLTVDASSTITMNASGEAMTAALTVKGNYINNGTTTLSGSVGGDLALEGNLTDNGAFTANARAIFFRGGNTQSITSNLNPLDIDVMRVEKSGGEVVLAQNLLVDETADPIQFANTLSILNLNGFTATFGKAGTASTITMNSTSAIKGSSTSSLIILGTGAAGTIRFDQTTPGTTNVLQNLTINRTSTGTVTLGNALTVGGNLTLTDGTLTVGGNTLTYAGSSIARTSGVIDASNANATLAFTNTSALTLPASLFSGNVNNLTMNGTGGVTLGSATTIAGVLNLSSGDIITSSTNTLTLTSAASISNGGSSSYIEGPLDRTLANGSSFSYPIGGNSTNYRPINLNSVSVTGNPVVRVTVAETGATTVDETTLSSLLNARNWRIEQISGTFTSATLVITESGMTNDTHEIGKSNSNQAGTYVSVGTPQTVSSGSVTSPVVQGVGFYAIGVNFNCTNPTAGGTIAETQTICSGGDPAAFTSSVAASGNVGTLEYKWQYSSTSDFSSDINDIASSNAETYDAPSGFTATRYYRRLARVSCKADWTGSAESNILTVTVDANPTVTFTAQPGATACASTDVTYTTQSGQSSYAWTFTGSSGTDYSITSGGTSSDNTVTLKWLTSGNKTVTVNYNNASGCAAASATSSTATTIQIVTWSGSPGSWDSTPTASTSAVIQSTYQISENITACSLRVTSGATVVVLSGVVTLNGPIIAESSNSFVTFNNNAILLQTGSGYVNTGNINYKKASSPIFRLDYTLWSSPLTAASQPVFSFSPQTLTNRFYTYNENTNLYTTDDMYSSGTPALSASSSFKVGRGYLIRSPNNWVSSPSAAAAWTGTFTGVPNNGDIAVAINYSGENKGYNAVGNPYPSPISIASFLTDNSDVIDSTLWFWRKTNGAGGSAYITYSGTTFSSGPSDSLVALPDQPADVIQPGQGFFVKATSSGSLQFNNLQRVGNNGSFFRNNSQTTAEGEGRLWLNLKSNAIVVGNMALGYKEGATNYLDLLYDGEYLNDSSLALTFSLPGKELSVQHRAAPFVDTDVVPLSFKTDVAGTFSIDFNGTDGVLDSQDIYLEDLLLGQSVAIKTTPYTFASAAGTFSDRFRIVYINNALGTDVPVFNANQVVIYKNEINDFFINSGNVIMSNIKVYDVRGRLLQEYKNVNDSQTTINVGLVNQVLLVQITSEDGVMVTKKVIR